MWATLILVQFFSVHFRWWPSELVFTNTYFMQFADTLSLFTLLIRQLACFGLYLGGMQCLRQHYLGIIC